ncbi:MULTISPECIES: TetR/AcrR family transcriptional regulator [unclassified Streptomyces]|uniref:TetR/AcrR family transcriptional regulator n=1 Tax=unclassified Streptomyces TaxID=2593676 RepID=UPI00093B7188|nr:helix-turn-helix domain-containing protein [Streptomyces sp. CB02414]
MAERPTIRTRIRLGAEQGLRARRRRELMQHVQDVALELFDAHGYDSVTIERIAEAADVSASTVYRHFGTKEHLVLHDEYHPAIALLVEQSPDDEPPLHTWNRAVTTGLGSLTEGQLTNLRRRLGYAFTVPAVHSAMLASIDGAPLHPTSAGSRAFGEAVAAAATAG